MTANINEALGKIKQVGPSNTRVVTMDGKAAIEIREDGSWHQVVTGLTQKMAEDLVAQATNRTILG